MKRFGDYQIHIRAEALRRLREYHNIKVWDSTFDMNSDRVLAECAAVERGEPVATASEKPMYTWTPEMVTAYQNSRQGTPGSCKSITPPDFWAA